MTKIVCDMKSKKDTFLMNKPVMPKKILRPFQRKEYPRPVIRKKIPWPVMRKEKGQEKHLILLE